MYVVRMFEAGNYDFNNFIEKTEVATYSQAVECANKWKKEYSAKTDTKYGIFIDDIINLNTIKVVRVNYEIDGVGETQFREVKND